MERPPAVTRASRGIVEGGSPRATQATLKGGVRSASCDGRLLRSACCCADVFATTMVLRRGVVRCCIDEEEESSEEHEDAR